MNDNMNNQWIPTNPNEVPNIQPNMTPIEPSTQPQIQPNTVIPQQNPMMETQTTIGPQFASPVAPLNNEQPIQPEQPVVPSQEIQNSVVTENLAPGNTEQFTEPTSEDNITIDYNQLYGVNNEVKEDVVVEEDNDRHVFTEQEVVIETPSIIERVNADITPEFNLNALEGNIDQTESKLTENVLSEKQQSRAETRRAIMYLVVLFLLIAICLIWVFPMIAGAN